MVYLYVKLFGAESVDAISRDAGSGAAIGIILSLFVLFVFQLTNRLLKDDDLEY